ncbi:hypothetical protein P9112_014092 [Eukaryota sp. TZLM1-RC]
MHGTCRHMCPPSERQERERNRQLDPLEIVPGTDHESSESLAVKAFPRSAAGTALNNPENLRPLPILQQTLSHLESLLDSTDLPLSDICAFINDRLRSIYQDLTIQEIRSPQAISIHERMCLLYILLDYLQADEDQPSATTAVLFKQLSSLLSALGDIYSQISYSENEVYFRSLLIFTHINSQKGFNLKMSEDILLSFHRFNTTCMSKLKSDQDYKVFNWTNNIIQAISSRNFLKFFEFFTQSDFFQATLLLSTARQFRRYAISAISSNFLNYSLPLTTTTNWLAITSDRLIELVKLGGLRVENNQIMTSSRPSDLISFPDVPGNQRTIPGERMRPSLDSMLDKPFSKVLDREGRGLLTVSETLDDVIKSKSLEKSMESVLPQKQQFFHKEGGNKEKREGFVMDTRKEKKLKPFDFPPPVVIHTKPNAKLTRKIVQERDFTSELLHLPAKSIPDSFVEQKKVEIEREAEDARVKEKEEEEHQVEKEKEEFHRKILLNFRKWNLHQLYSLFSYWKRVDGYLKTLDHQRKLRKETNNELLSRSFFKTSKVRKPKIGSSESFYKTQPIPVLPKVSIIEILEELSKDHSTESSSCRVKKLLSICFCGFDAYSLYFIKKLFSKLPFFKIDSNALNSSFALVSASKYSFCIVITDESDWNLLKSQLKSIETVVAITSDRFSAGSRLIATEYLNLASMTEFFPSISLKNWLRLANKRNSLSLCNHYFVELFTQFSPSDVGQIFSRLAIDEGNFPFPSFLFNFANQLGIYPLNNEFVSDTLTKLLKKSVFYFSDLIPLKNSLITLQQLSSGCPFEFGKDFAIRKRRSSAIGQSKHCFVCPN